MVAKVVNQDFVSGNEPSQGGERLAECTHDEIYLIGESVVVAHSTTILPQYPKAMRLVHHYGGIVALCKFYNLREVTYIPFHRKHTIHDDKFHLIGGTLS